MKNSKKLCLFSGRNLLLVLILISLGSLLYLRHKAMAADSHRFPFSANEVKRSSRKAIEIPSLSSSTEDHVRALAQKKLAEVHASAKENEKIYRSWSPLGQEINQAVWQMRETKGNIAFLYAKQDLIAALSDEDTLLKIEELVTNYGKDSSLHYEASPELIYYGFYALGAAAKERGLERFAGITQQLAKDLGPSAKLSKEMLESRKNDLYDLVWQSSRHVIKDKNLAKKQDIDDISQFMGKIGLTDQKWSPSAQEKIYSAMCRGMDQQDEDRCIDGLKNIVGINKE